MDRRRRCVALLAAAPRGEALVRSAWLGACMTENSMPPSEARAASLANWRALDEQLGPDCLRIATYNLHGCVGRDGERDAAAHRRGDRRAGLRHRRACRRSTPRLDRRRTGHAGDRRSRRTSGTGAMSAMRCSPAARCSTCATTTAAGPGTSRAPRSTSTSRSDGEPVRVIVTHLGLKPGGAPLPGAQAA